MQKLVDEIDKGVRNISNEYKENYYKIFTFICLKLINK